MTAIRRISNYRPELLEQQPENGFALASGPAQTLRLVMEDGAIVEQGNHAELLEKHGAYSRLYDAQFAAPIDS